MNKRLGTGTLLLFLVSLLLGLFLAEGVSRFMLPISPGSRLLDLEGRPVVLDNDRLRLPRGLQYREVTQEFDVVITVTAQGHRVPGTEGNPQIVFLGDSFTLGTGLSDEQTYVAQYCNELRLACANLGRGGTGTKWQLDILEEFLESEGWRPKELRLFMVVMGSALLAGNDLTDNLSEARKADGNHHQSGSLLAKVLSYRKLILRHSNLARVIYFYFGPQLRTMLSPTPYRAELDLALNTTEKQLIRLEGLAHYYGFNYKIYLVYPMQDLIRGTHRQTLDTIIPIMPPNRHVVDTSSVLLDDPASYYYPYDGHLNPKGATRIAELLIREHTADGTEKEN